MVTYNLLKKYFSFQKNFLNIGKGLKLHYVDEGSGDPIVMVHGNPTWSFYYRNIINEFKKDYRMIAPDHIGCGLSDKPEDYEYNLQNHISNLDLLIKTLDLKNITLIVHDWGGAIGLGYAVSNPEKIKRVVILNTAAFTSNHIPKRINFCKIPYVGEFIVRNFNGFAYPATFMAVKKRMNKDLKKCYLYPYNNPKNRVAISRFIQDIPMNSNHPTYSLLLDIENKLNRLKCPKLILWGGKDFCFNMHFFNRWCQIYPDAQKHLFEDAGHYVLEDAKEMALKKIESFINVENQR